MDSGITEHKRLNTFSGHHPGRYADLHRYSLNTWIALAGITELKRLNTFSGHYPGRNADLHRYSLNTWIALAGITELKRLKNKMMLGDW